MSFTPLPLAGGPRRGHTHTPGETEGKIERKRWGGEGKVGGLGERDRRRDRE